MKALGVGLGSFALRDVEVRARRRRGAPSLVLRGRAEALARERGVHGLARCRSRTPTPPRWRS